MEGSSSKGRRRRARMFVATLLVFTVLHRIGPEAANGSAYQVPVTSGQESGAEPNLAQTRPRRVGSSDKSKSSDSGRGPLVRVGLMTDVSSITITADLEMVIENKVVRDDDRGDAEVNLISAREVRIEVQQKSRSDGEAYRVEITTLSDSKSARKAADELARDFEQRITTTYSADLRRYVVLIGDVESRREAELLVNRLARKGFKEARLFRVEKAAQSNASTAQSVGSRRLAVYEAGKEISSNPGPMVVTTLQAYLARNPRRAVRVKEVAVRNNQDRDRLPDNKEKPNKPEPGFRSAQKVPGDREHVQHKDLAGPTVLRIGTRGYRGDIEVLLNSRGSLNLVNVLTLEDYLKGVVPMELSPRSFPEIEALKAQAIAARTYALARMNAQGRHQREGFDLRDDARSQVYGGLTAEHPLTNRAVDETRGMVAVYGGAPIEALYASTCGGRTEDSELVFSGGFVPYLRSVACSIDSRELRKHEIESARGVESLSGPDGRSIAREFALLDVLAFQLPRRPSLQYLRAIVDKDEARNWANRAATLFGEPAPRPSRGDPARLAPFGSLIASAVYGEARASVLLAPADVDYLLNGLAADRLASGLRADIALLLREGILRLPAGARLSEDPPVSRSHAIEITARAILKRLEQPLPQGPGSLSAKPGFSGSLRMAVGVALPTKEGRLVVESDSSRNSRKQDARKNEPTALDVEDDVWLFRRLGDTSYQVNQLALIGGERILFHVNNKGRVDFVEAEPAARGASSDRTSSVSFWQVRIPAAEMRRRLARNGIDVGEIEDLQAVNYSPSNRTIQLKVLGTRGTRLMRGSAIRNVLGLRENLFIIDREREALQYSPDDQPPNRADGGRTTDLGSRVAAFVFTGRGWGHGVGLCQTGAYGLAKEGYTSEQILRKYYSGIRILPLY